MGLVNEVKTLGGVASPNGKTSTDMLHFAKQNIKMTLMLNNANLQRSTL